MTMRDRAVQRVVVAAALVAASLVGCGTPPPGCAVIPAVQQAELFSQGATRAGMAVNGSGWVVYTAPPVNGRSFAYQAGDGPVGYVSLDGRDDIPAELGGLAEQAMDCAEPI